MSIGIVIPCIFVDKLTKRCVLECRKKYPQAEIIVVVDYTNEGSREISDDAMVLVSGKSTISAKRNMGVKQSSSRYIAFIDSDAYPADSWLEPAQKILAKNSDIATVGGPNIPPPEEPDTERYVGLALKSFFVSGSFNFRKFISPARYCDNLPSCNLIVRREEYLNMGGMDEKLYSSEDNDFCYQLRKSGKKIYFSPDVVVYHKNRSIKQFINQRLVYGATVWELLFLSKSILDCYMLAPFILVLFIASGPISFFFTPWLHVYLSVLAFYFLVLWLEAMRLSPSIADTWGTFWALLVGNLIPGVGTLGRLVGVMPDLSKIYKNYE